MAKAGQKFDRSVTRIQTSLGRMEDKFKSAGAKMANLQTGLASLGAGIFLKSTIDEAKQFQQALNLTKAVTGSTGEQMDIMRAQALEWGASTQFSSLQVSQAMAELGKMGNDTNQILDLMPGTMALAAAGEISMAEAANYSMATINQMGLQLSDAGMVADILATGASNAATSVSELASAFTNTGLQAKLSGLDMQDTTAALMALAGAGLDGAIGGTMMMNALKSLQVMTPKVRAGFEDMGINIDNFRDSTTGQMTDFYGLIGAMKDAGATGAQMGKMFDVRAMKAMAVLVETDTEKLQGFRDALKDTTGASKEMQDTLLEGLQPFVEFESVTQNLKVIMGGFVMEALTPALEAFNEWLGNMQKNNPETLKWITYILMGVTALGAILIPLGLMISAIGSVIGVIRTVIGITKIWTVVQTLLNSAFWANPITWIIAGIIALIAVIVLVVKYWDNIVIAVKNAWTWIGNFYEKIKGLIFLFGGPLGIAFVLIIELIKKVVQNWDKIKEAFIVVGGIIKEKFFEVVEAIRSGAQTMWNWFSKIIDNPFFAAIATIVAPWLTIPALIIKHWEPLKEFFVGIWEKITGVVSAVSGFGGGIIDALFGESTMTEAMGTPSGWQPEAPTPGGGRRGANATANATVSVYTEKGMGVMPYEAEGDLGYNMVSTSSRGRRR
jgi:TP901 family phage tail tape measure protein